VGITITSNKVYVDPLNSPTGVAVDPGGHVFIADTSNHRILKFTNDGKFIRKWAGSDATATMVSPF
jgi:DNA-binding beta-propeller fold protein YncE